MNEIVKSNDQRIDELETEIILHHKIAVIPVKHLFTKGMYIREIKVPAGIVFTSKIHKTQHPFTLSEGKIKVRENSGEWVTLTAPFTGITQIGTRRVCVVLENCTWTTYHHYSTIKGTENNLPESEKEKIALKIEHRIILKRKNKVLLKAKKINKLLCHSY